MPTRGHCSAYYEQEVFQHNFFWVLSSRIFLGPYAAKDPERSATTNSRNKAGVGALCVFWLALEPSLHEIGGVLDASPGRLLRLCDGSLHHRL
jgi:hypothetical protein